MAEQKTNGIDANSLIDITLDQAATGGVSDDTPSGGNGEATTAGNNDATDPAALHAQLTDLQTKLDQEHEAYLRARADFANYKRRNDEEKERIRSIVGEDILTGLLPVVDNFERALSAAEATRDYEKLVGGVQATLRQMQAFLTKQGVEPIQADPGDLFDPNVHNAVLRDETTEYAENTIVEELQKGYTLSGRVLRPAMVKVATGAE